VGKLLLDEKIVEEFPVLPGVDIEIPEIVSSTNTSIISDVSPITSTSETFLALTISRSVFLALGFILIVFFIQGAAIRPLFLILTIL